MIASLTRGRGFRGLLNYVFSIGKQAIIVGGNMVGQTPQALAFEFAAVRTLNLRVRTPVWHCSLSLAPGEQLSDTNWNAIAKSLLDKMGLGSDRPWIAVRHRDKDHSHIHIITSRTDYFGRIWYGDWEVKRLLAAKDELERDFNLTRVPVTQPSEAKLTKRQTLKISREIRRQVNAEIPPNHFIAARIDAAISATSDIQELIRLLHEDEIEIELNKSKSTGRVSGAKFRTKNGEWIKGSSLGKRYAWQQLQQRLESKKHHENFGAREIPVQHQHLVVRTQSPERGSVPFETEQPSIVSDQVGKQSRSLESEPRKSLGFPDFASIASPSTGHNATGADTRTQQLGGTIGKRDEQSRGRFASHMIVLIVALTRVTRSWFYKRTFRGPFFRPFHAANDIHFDQQRIKNQRQTIHHHR